MPKSRIKRGFKYSQKDESERAILQKRRIIADKYWISDGDVVNLWKWQNEEYGPFNAENFQNVPRDDPDTYVDEDDQALYPSIYRIEPEPMFEVIWRSSTDANPALIPIRLTRNKPVIEVLKVQEYLRKWFFDINYVIEDKEYPGLLVIGTRYIIDVDEAIHCDNTLYLCGICLSCMACSKEDVKSHLKLVHKSDPVATVPVLQNPKPSRKRKQKLHPTRSTVPLEVPEFEPVEKIKVKVKRRPWAKRDYMDKTSKKRTKQTKRQPRSDSSEAVVEIPFDSSAVHDTRQLEEIIEEFTSTANEQHNPPSSRSETWDDRMETLYESWGNMRPKIGESVGKSRKPPSEDRACQMCTSRRATLRCVTCSHFLCCSCDIQAHIRMPFHKREHWLLGPYQVLMPQETVDSSGIKAFDCFLPIATSSVVCTTCNEEGRWERSEEECQKIIVVTLQGRYDVKLELLRCCKCSKTHTYSFMDFYQSGFFPGSVSRVVSVFSMDLLNLCMELQYNSPGLTLNSIIKSLEGVSKFQVHNINQTTFTKALEEYEYFAHDLAKLKGEDGLTCPACSPVMHSIMIDGNMKLKRLKHVSKGERQSYYGSELFIPDGYVNQHVLLPTSTANNPPSKDSDKCGESHWKAAKERSHRMAKLDQTGVFGATCRHVVPLRILNMFQGEIFAYAHCMHDYFVNKETGRFEYLWYDIICQYWKYCERMDVSTGNMLSTACQPALPLMHSKGHSSTCQILWGGDWKTGAGSTSGEEMEQFWAFLSNACKPTKYMGNARREEAITRLASYWGRSKVKVMPEYLQKRYKKVRRLLIEAEQELLKQKEYDLNGMKQEIIDHAKEANNSSKASADVEYFKLRKEQDVWEALANGQPDPISRIVTGTMELHQSLEKKLDARLARLATLQNVLGETCLAEGQLATAMSIAQTQQNTIEVNVHTYNSRVEKFISLAETSKDRARIRKANTATMKLIEKSVETYNTAAEEINNNEKYPQIRTEDMPGLVKGNFPWESEVTLGHKRELVNKKESVARLQEEEALLKQEMKQFLLYYAQNPTKEIVAKEQTYLSGLLKSGYHHKERKLFFDEQMKKGLHYFRDITDIPEIQSESDSDNSDSESDFSETE